MGIIIKKVKEGILEELRNLKREFSENSFEVSQAIDQLEYALEETTIENIGSQEVVDLQKDSIQFIINSNRKIIEFNNQMIEDLKAQEKKVKEMF